MSTEPIHIASHIASFSDLLNLLARQRVFYHALPADQSIQVPTRLGELSGVLTVRWQDADGVVQFIQTLPMLGQVPLELISTVESALVRLNHALALPGFDLDHRQRTLAYRLLLPIYPRGYIYPVEIQGMFGYTVRNAAALLPTLREVLNGEILPVEVIESGRRDLAAAAALTAPSLLDDVEAEMAAPARLPRALTIFTD